MYAIGDLVCAGNNPSVGFPCSLGLIGDCKQSFALNPEEHEEPPEERMGIGKHVRVVFVRAAIFV